MQTDHGMQVNVAGEEQNDIAVDPVIPAIPPEDEASFGPWLKPRSRERSTRDGEAAAGIPRQQPSLQQIIFLVISKVITKTNNFNHN